MLEIDLQAEILSLHFGKKMSVRSIARELGLNRKSVARVIERKMIAEKRKLGPKTSILDPYKPMIKEILLRNPHVTGTAILNRMRDEGFTGGRSLVYRWLQKIREPIPRREAFLRLSFEAGECA